MKKNISLLIFIFLFLCSQQLESQNYSCQPFFLIPNRFIDLGMIFGNKLSISNLGSKVNSPSYDYAPTVSIDGKTIYFVSDRKGSKIVENYTLPYLERELFSVKKDMKGDAVYYSESVSFNTFLKVVLSRAGIMNFEALINAEEKTESMTVIVNAIKKLNLKSKLGIKESDLQEQSRGTKYITRISGIVGKLDGKFEDLKKEIFELYSEPFSEDNPLRAYILLEGEDSFFKSEEEFIYESLIQYSHDFWSATKSDKNDTVFTIPRNIDTSSKYGYFGVNTHYHEGAASIAADGRSLFFTGCDREDGLGNCDIYYSTIEDETWSRPENLGRNVNSKNFDTQPSIAPDKSRIYFISTRKGPNSNGREDVKNFDIWYSDYDHTNGNWKKAVNLEQINTPGQEACPFISADGKTLFFSSDSLEPNFGGLDFYVSRFDPESKTWSEPINLGKPLNSEKDDMFLSIPATGDILYFSSDRTDLPGFQGSLDLYMAKLPSESTICMDRDISSAIPNPFNSRTKINFVLDNPDDVEITIYNVEGRIIKNLFKGHLNSGEHEFFWDGTNNNNAKETAGAFFYNIILGRNNDYYQERKQVIMVK